MMSYNTAVGTHVPPQRPLTPRSKKGSPRYTTDSISHFVSPKVNDKRAVTRKPRRASKKKDGLTNSMKEILFRDNSHRSSFSEVSNASYDLSERNYDEDEKSTGGVSHLSSTSLMSMGSAAARRDPAENYLFMAEYRKSKKQYDRALTFYLKALKVKTKALGVEHIETVPIINEMAWILYQQKEYEKAMKKYQKALNIRIKALGWDHDRTAEIYCHIANILHIQGHYAGAMRVYQLVLAIRLKSLKRDDPDLADTYFRIARVHYDLEEWEQSLKNYQRVWAIQFKNIGLEHLDTATTYFCIANVLKQQNKKDNARTMYREALKIREKKLGKKHSDTIKTQELLDELSSDNSYFADWGHQSMSAL